MDTKICPTSKRELIRGTRPLTLTHHGESITFEMPGWYPEGEGAGLHDSADLKVSDAAQRELKRRAMEAA